MRIKTSNLKNLVGKVTKIKENRMLEITRYYFLQANDKGVSILAHDGNNFIAAIDKTLKQTESLEVIVRAEQFAKLIEKTSVEYIELELSENCLEVKGNGRYKVEIVTGEIYPTFEPIRSEATIIKNEDIKRMINTNKSAVSTSPTEGILNGYLLGNDKAITADGIKVCATNIDYKGPQVLLTKEMVELVSTITEETVQLLYLDGVVEFISDSVIIHGAEFDGKEEYPDLTQLISMRTDSKCKISKLALQSTLDRLTLFQDAFSKNEVKLNFIQEGLLITTPSGSEELIPYSESNKFTPFICSVNAVYLKELISSTASEAVTINYGEEDALIIEDVKVVLILATGDEE